MKKSILLVTFLLFCINGLFASGEMDQQSEALLYKQKRVKWDNAPDSATFYECYMVNFRENNGGTNAILLDHYIKNDIMIINPASSMEIIATNGNEMLKQDRIVYKCTVLYSSSLLGAAIVNIFEAEPVTQQIGYVVGPYTYSYMDISMFIDDIDSGILYSIISYAPPTETSIIFVYFPLLKRSFLQIDQWPSPTNLTVIDGRDLLTQSYNNGYIEREKYDEIYKVLSGYNLLRL